MDLAGEARKQIALAEGASGDHLDTYQAAHLNTLQAIGYALLDVADAIREQTKTIDTELPDIRIALQEMQQKYGQHG